MPCAGAATLPEGFEEETLAAGLSQPTAVAWTPDGRMLVVEKPGRLKVVPPGSKTASLAWDFSSRVATQNDRGAGGIAVDPAFATNRYVYVLYAYATNPLDRTGPSQSSAQLVRLQLSPTNVVSDVTVLLGKDTSFPCPPPSNTVDCIPDDSDSHTVGTVRAAPDGTLYVGSGDGASYALADSRALRTFDETSLNGKILHIDRNGRGLPGHPFCPSDTDLSHTCTKVFAKGFRNPFRFSLRPGGGLTVGDVGWGTTEEVDVVPPAGGLSYGWPCYEGNAQTYGYRDLAACQAEYAKRPNPHTAPVFTWCHCTPGGGNAVIVGPAYTGARYPAGYQGTTFVGDYAARWLGRIDPDGTAKLFATDWAGGVDLELDPTGDLVYVTVGNFSDGSGRVVAIRYPEGDRAPVARASAAPTSGAAPLAVSFDGSASSDPDGDPLTYAWAFGDGSTSTAASPAHTYAQPGTYQATLTVDDGQGRTDSDQVTVTAGNSAPEATISAPVSGATYREGEPVALAGGATDPQDGTLPGTALSWRVLLLHGDHPHLQGDLSGAAPSFTPATDHDADSSYEVTLTATDSGGLTDTDTIELDPQTADLVLGSTPGGATLTWAGTGRETPWTGVAAVGFQTTVNAPPALQTGGRDYRFDRWSDGGARSHQITVPPTPLTLTATYVPLVAATPTPTPTPRPSPAPTASPSPTATPAPPTPARRVTRLRFGVRSQAVRLRGGAHRVRGHRGRGVAFDGVDDEAVVRRPPRLDARRGFTVSAWVKPRRRSGPQTVLATEAYGLVLRGKRLAPAGVVGGRRVRAAVELRPRRWHRLVLSDDGAVARLSVDGRLRAARRLPAPAGATGPLHIGRGFRGVIDELALADGPPAG